MTTTQPEPGAGTCKHCHNPMRFFDTPAGDYPGTRQRQRANECKPCVTRLTRHGVLKPTRAPRPPAPPIGPPAPETLTAYRLFLAGRARRGATTNTEAKA